MASSAIFFELKLDGDITRLLLRKRKLTQRRAAKLLGVSPSQFVQYLAGKYPVQQRRFARLVKILQIQDNPSIILRPEVVHA